jgi:hypothetical protein
MKIFRLMSEGQERKNGARILYFKPMTSSLLALQSKKKQVENQKFLSNVLGINQCNGAITETIALGPALLA